MLIATCASVAAAQSSPSVPPVLLQMIRDDAADSLGLTTSQRQSINQSCIKTDQQASEIQRKMHDGETSAEDANKEIRRWWQGEMNWKGTPGEQQIRQTIEQLLAEDS